MQIKELNARLKQMAEEKRAVQKDRDRLERIVKSAAETSTKSSEAQVCMLGCCCLHAQPLAVCSRLMLNLCPTADCPNHPDK